MDRAQMEKYWDRWTRQANVQLARLFELERVLVLQAINSSVPDTVVVAALLAFENKRLRQGKQDFFNWLYRGTANSIGKRVYRELLAEDNLRRGRKADMSEPWMEYAIRYARLFSSRKIVMIDETTRDTIRGMLADGIVEGAGIRELARRIDTLYLEQIIPNRSRVISRTEAIASCNCASLSGAMGAGPGWLKQWLATGDDRTREAHRLASGQRRRLEQPFIVWDEPLMFPGDNSMGASGRNVIQCRCTMTYVRQGQE